MRIMNEIQRAVKYLNANAPVSAKIDDAKIEACVVQTVADLNSGNYDFSTYNSMVLKQGAKKRQVKLFKLFSTENILCQCVKQILDRIFKVRYPNRNKVIHTLFDFLKAARQMSEFTIIKFDFKDYFNSVSSVYTFEKYIKGQMTDRAETELISAFASQTKYSYAGLNTSNLFSEIIATKFDELVRQAFSQYGLLFFERYIDDTIIILNKHLEQAVCDKILDDSLQQVYHNASITTVVPCKTKFNPSKFKMITRRSLNAIWSSVDFLGYEFFFKTDAKGKVAMQYGITAEKQNKYCGRVDEIIEDYKKNNDYQPFFETIRQKVKLIIGDRIDRISPHEQMLQEEFWYVLIFHNCTLLDTSCQSQIQTVIDSIGSDAAVNPKNYPNKKIAIMICEFLNTKKGFFNWDNSKRISESLTYRTFQRTLFKRYKGSRYGLYASID